MTTPRAQEVDLLRSVALFGICIANMPYLGLPIDVLIVPPGHGPDRVAAFLSALLVQGKFFVLFSFLFGWGFGVQLEAAARRGTPPAPLYLRRLAGLLAIGAAHAALVFYGDILMLYALLGLLLWRLRNLSTPGLLRVALTCAGVAALAYAAIGAAATAPELLPAPAGPSGYLGGFGAAVTQRLADWTLAVPFLLLFNGPLALGAFALGLAAHRNRFFEAESVGLERLARWVPALLVIGLAANTLYALATVGAVATPLRSALFTAALALGSPALAAVYLWAVVRAARAWPGLRLSAGRISLSGYVAQGALAGIVFAGYGFGLFGRIGLAGLVAVALAIAASVELAAAFWLRRFRTGPLEMLLRRITYGPGRPIAS